MMKLIIAITVVIGLLAPCVCYADSTAAVLDNTNGPQYVGYTTAGYYCVDHNVVVYGPSQQPLTDQFCSAY